MTRTGFASLILLALVTAAAHAEVVVPMNDEAARQFYANSQLVITKQVVDASQLAGCLVLRKSGEADQYLNILPETVRQMLKPQNLSSKAYRTMLTQEEATKVGFLGLLGVSAKKECLLEISITDVWQLDAPTFISTDEVKGNVLLIGKIYRDMGYSVWYNQAVKYSALVTSQYRKNEKSAALTFSYVDGDGRRYVQEESYTSKELISISPFDITPLLDKLTPDPANKSNTLNLDPEQINKFKAERAPGGALSNLQPADMGLLMTAASKFAAKYELAGVDKLITGLD